MYDSEQDRNDVVELFEPLSNARRTLEVDASAGWRCTVEARARPDLDPLPTFSQGSEDRTWNLSFWRLSSEGAMAVLLHEELVVSTFDDSGDSPVGHKPHDSHAHVDGNGYPWFEDRHNDPHHIRNGRDSTLTVTANCPSQL